MATLPLRNLWIGGQQVAFAEGSALDTDLTALRVVSLEVRLPLGVNEKVALKVELSNGRVYEGQATTKMPRDVGGRNQPTLHVYDFVATPPLEPAN